MIRLTFATSNEGKLQEAQFVLSPLGIEIQPVAYNFAEPMSGTIQEIALEKLQQVTEQGYDHIFVEDSGVFFAAYDQFPGVLSKRVFQGIGYHGLEKLLQDEQRDAWFMGTIALYWQGEIQTFTATTDGLIVKKKATIIPKPGLPFDPIFIPKGEQQVFYELPMEKRLRYSYRQEMLMQMARWIQG